MKRIPKNYLAYSIIVAALLLVCCSDEDNSTDTFSEIKLSKSVLGIFIGETYTLSATSNTEDNIQWSSNKPDIATINSEGIVTGVSEGTAIVTSKSGDSKAICTVVISKKTYDLELNNNSLRLYPYPEYAQSLEVVTDVEGNEITWESSDPSIATVDQNGNVTPIAIGETAVIARFDEFFVDCFVEVVEGPVTLIQLNESELVMKTFQTDQLAIETIESELEEIGIPVWESSNPNIVSVDNEGQLNSFGEEGTVTVTVTVDNLTVEAKVTVTPAIVYVAGYDNDRATLWKNNEALNLTDGSESESEAEFVHVTDEDNIYTTGHIGSFGSRSVKLWNNDQELYSFTDGTEDARGKAILLYNGNIYTVGFEDYTSGNLTRKIATIWRNGNPQPEYELTDGTKDAVAYSFFEDSGEFYVSGYEKETASVSSALIPKVWTRNGQVDEEIVLPNESDDGIAYSIKKSNDDIYTVGYDRQNGTLTAIVWKKSNNNGSFTATTLSAGGSAIAYSVDTHNGNVYIAGYEIVNGERIAKIWDENGNTIYNLNSDGVDQARAYSVYVTDNGDIYAAGYEENDQGNQVAKIWKNGELHLTLTDGSNDARALSIAVK